MNIPQSLARKIADKYIEMWDLWMKAFECEQKGYYFGMEHDNPYVYLTPETIHKESICTGIILWAIYRQLK